MSTAKPQSVSKGDGLMSVIQQQGGFVKPLDAAHATTLVEPPSLAFNDTDHGVSSISLHIPNLAKSEVTDNFPSLHANATTLYIFQWLFYEPDPIKAEPVEATADIQLSKDSLTLGPGRSGTIDMSDTDSSSLDTDGFPVWSGWIVVMAPTVLA